MIGTLITVASVMIPARRAAKTEPIEALRDAAVETQPVLARPRSSRRRRSSAAASAGLLFGAGAPRSLGLGALRSSSA